MRRPVALLPAVAALAFACDLGAGKPWPQTGGSSGIVAGVIRDTSGRALSGVAIAANAFWLSDGTPSYSTGDATTRSDGSYLVRLTSLETSDVRASLGIGAAAPFGSPLHTIDTTGLSVLLSQTVPPPETTYVNIIMR